MNIKVSDIEVELSGNRILKSISVDTSGKEFVGIIGPNGSGKSTLLKCIYRVLKPSGGTVLLDGKELEQYRVKESARKLAVVSQHNYYNFEFTIEEIVLMGRAPHKRTMERDNQEDYRIVKECLGKVGMEEYRGRVFSTLSGGEQQRIILARALAQKTESLILDEPTNHLDIKYQLQLLDIVKNLGITVIGAFHDLNIAAAYCDRIYAIKAGKIVASGTPEEVITEKLIKELYEVDASVGKDGYGMINITYRPLHVQAMSGKAENGEDRQETGHQDFAGKADTSQQT